MSSRPDMKWADERWRLQNDAELCRLKRIEAAAREACELYWMNEPSSREWDAMAKLREVLDAKGEGD